MGKIIYIMGKSASGKDTIFSRLQDILKLKKVVMYTTRPMRDGEQEGREYFFRDDAFFEAKKQAGLVIEARTYNTISGPWTYFTLNDDQIDLEKGNSLMIGTLESYRIMKEYFDRKGIDALEPVYVYLDDGERLIRAVRREQSQNTQNYPELCRRFLADDADFSEEKLLACGITKRYENVDLETCIGEIIANVTKI